ncbi:hypothetical protein P3T73_03590 [Kiritimatiellota bacterium B12222]|nr:hypothetical protein P3T73_03590 [Kiritimatiellota bacterium B12222]
MSEFSLQGAQYFGAWVKKKFVNGGSQLSRAMLGKTEICVLDKNKFWIYDELLH